jgi:acetaldehyde dehydrogenase (acetylating)
MALNLGKFTLVPLVNSEGKTTREGAAELAILQRIINAATSTVVASLPSAATAGAGARHFVTDATATTFLSVVAGGGANKVPVVSDGTNWLIG